MSKLLFLCLIAFSCAYLSYGRGLGYQDLPVDDPVVKAITHYATHVFNQRVDDMYINVLKKVLRAGKIVSPFGPYNLDVVFAKSNCLKKENGNNKLCIIQPNAQEIKIHIDLNVNYKSQQVEKIDFTPN